LQIDNTKSKFNKEKRILRVSLQILTFSFLMEGVCLPTVSSLGLLGKIVGEGQPVKENTSELSTEQLKRQQVNPGDTWE
jgi:hypothetical protein